MLPAFNEEEKALVHAMESQGLDAIYSVQKKVKGTNLYSVYFVSAKEGTQSSHEVLLVEHPPAAEPTAHLLGLRIMELSTSTDTMRKVTEAMDAYFAEK